MNMRFYVLFSLNFELMVNPTIIKGYADVIILEK